MTATQLESIKVHAVRTKVPLRKDVQALRACAIVLVVLNHLWPTRLPGGYIGVDIFFVISGFLITAHIRREIDIRGRIDMPSFWARRAKRLLPASFTVLAFTLLITATCIPLPSRQTAYDQIGSAGTYVLNWLLAASSMNYFAAGTSGTPVTHYWSLSVEEQFYFVWPLLIGFCLVLVGRSNKQARETALVSIFGLVGVISLVWAVHNAVAAPTAAYFETGGRAWEFAVGGLLAFAPSAKARNNLCFAATSWAAWAVLIIGALLFNPSSGFPGLAAITPVLATAALIWIGDVEHRTAPTEITSLSAVQFVGGISYSLYLWHWPLILVAPFILNRDLTARDKLVIALVAVSIAALSKRYIEDPVRTSNRPAFSRPRHIFVGAAALMVIVLTVSVASSSELMQRGNIAAQNVYQESQRPGQCFGAQAVLSGANCTNSHVLSAADSVLVSANNQLNPVSNGNICQAGRGAPGVSTCSFGVAAGTQRLSVALIGDSHAGMWATALNAIAEARGLRVTEYLASACAPTLDPTVEYLDKASAAGCLHWREDAIAQVTNDKSIDVVITSSNSRNDAIVTANGLRVEDTGDGYLAAWSDWIAAGKRVVVIDDVPQHPNIVPVCISRSAMSTDPCTMPAAKWSGPSPLAKAAAQEKSSSFTFVEFQSVFCDQVCHSVIGGIPAYLDSDHLSAAFVQSFVPEFLKIKALA
jgi:peptidoglycan/LPS O-acetylase OafA/YrhL